MFGIGVPEFLVILVVIAAFIALFLFLSRRRP